MILDKFLWSATAFLVGLVLGAWAGISWEEGQVAKRQNAAFQATITTANKQVKADDTAAVSRTAATDNLKGQTGKIKERIVYETVTNTVYRDCAITDNSLRDLTELVDRANAARGSASAVPKASGSAQ